MIFDLYHRLIETCTMYGFPTCTFVLLRLCLVYHWLGISSQHHTYGGHQIFHFCAFTCMNLFAKFEEEKTRSLYTYILGSIALARSHQNLQWSFEDKENRNSIWAFFDNCMPQCIKSPVRYPLASHPTHDSRCHTFITRLHLAW